MRDSVYSLTLDTSYSTSQAQITAKKNDTARTLVATLSDKGKPYIIEEGCFAVFMAKKPSGAILENDCQINLASSRIEYEFTAQTTAEEGLTECEIRLYGADGEILTSPRFTLRVASVVYSDGQIESSDEFTALTEALTEANRLDIDASKEDNVTNITVTHKDGTTSEVELYDGASITEVTATIDDTIGTPSVEVTEGGTDFQKTIDFAFHGLKGEQGDTGETGVSISSIDDVDVTHESGHLDTYDIVMDDDTTKRIGIYNGTDGADGDDGVGVSSFELVSGTHAAGTTDTYRMTLTDGTTTDVTVWNGANGEGSGDMLASVYDPNGRGKEVAFASDVASDLALKANTSDVTSALADKADLDENGRVPYSQLPESAMEFKGTWNASTNTPTLTHGVGTNGDFYVVSVGGTWDGMTFVEGDRIIFDGTSTSWIRLAKGVENVNWDAVQNKPSTFPPSSHTHTKSEITDFPTSMTPTAHNQSASTISAGTLGGKVLANATAEATLGDSQVRNIYAGTSDLTAGTSNLATGSIYIMYE